MILVLTDAPCSHSFALQELCHQDTLNISDISLYYQMLLKLNIMAFPVMDFEDQANKLENLNKFMLWPLLYHMKIFFAFSFSFRSMTPKKSSGVQK